MTRRCLVCGNINPCSAHSIKAQNTELERNDREIAAIRASYNEYKREGGILDWTEWLKS